MINGGLFSNIFLILLVIQTSPSCARHVILALSPEEILELGFSLAPLSDIWRPQFEMLSRISLMRVLVEIGHDESLFPKGSPSWTSLRTDLPIQNVHVIESSHNMEQSTPAYGDRDNTTWSTDNDTSLSAYTTTIQINIYRDHLDYWTGLLTADGYSFAHDDVIGIDVTSSQFARQLARYLTEILSTTNNTIQISAESLTISVRLWSSSASTSAFHMWKPGVDWDATSRRIRYPIDDVRLYVTGSAYAPKYLQFWAEGALTSVDQLLREITFK